MTHLIPDNFFKVLARAQIPYEATTSGLILNGLEYRLLGGTLVNGDNCIDLGIGRNVQSQDTLSKQVLDLIPNGWSVACVMGGAILTSSDGSSITGSSIPEGLPEAVKHIEQADDCVMRVSLTTTNGGYSIIRAIAYLRDSKAPAPDLLWQFCSSKIPAVVRFSENAQPIELLSWRTANYIPATSGILTTGDQVLHSVHTSRHMSVSEFIETMIEQGYEDIL